MKTRAVMAAFLLCASFAFAGPGSYSGGGGGVKAKPGMVLPDTIYVATDREMNIYAAHLPTLGPLGGSAALVTTAPPVGGGIPFYFDFVSQAGTWCNRSYRWTPAAAADSLLTITAYDYSGKRVESASTVLSAIDKTSGSGVKQALFVGDSIFDGSGPYIISQVDSLFSVEFAVSAGANILPIGTQETTGYYHESHSGKNWNYFVTNPSGPFWKSGRLDFQQYMIDASIPGNIDLVCVNLGGNTAFVDFAAGRDRAMTAADVDSAVIDLAKAFVDTLMSPVYGFPQARIVFNLMPAPSALPSAYGNDYGGTLNGAVVNYQKSMREITKQMIETFDGGAYHANADVCYGGLWMDNLLGYPTAVVSSSAARIADDETRGTNFLHPDADGSYQIADAIYSHLLYAHTLGTGQNLLANSYNLATPTDWSVNAAWFTVTGAQADPWGLNHGMLIDSDITTANAAITSTAITAVAGTYAVSAVLKNVDRSTTEKSRVTLRDVTGAANVSNAYVTWAATPTYARDGALDAGGGLVDLGDGWWRVWVLVDMETIAGHSIRVDIAPFYDNDVVAGDAVIFGGAQLELGVLEPSGVYVEKP